jgi:hypothetical protein
MTQLSVNNDREMLFELKMLGKKDEAILYANRMV